jgi:hypothetical protein
MVMEILTVRGEKAAISPLSNKVSRSVQSQTVTINYNLIHWYRDCPAEAYGNTLGAGDPLFGARQ